MSKDVNQSAVYSAEDQWTVLLDRGGQVEFFGSTFDVPCQKRFGDVSAMQNYVADSIAAMREARGWMHLPIPTVRSRKGHTRAHYEPQTAAIAIPWDDTSLDAVWAARESVLLHECAHHIAHTRFASRIHDDSYVATMLTLVDVMLGEQAGLMLRVGYQECGVPIPGNG
ncbi:MAG: hypothetical protein RJB01_1847 [Actinomycetota bacterium]|jgi:putative metallohydrolase (TIGR04338 family)